MLGGVANPELRNPATAGHHGDGAALGQEIRERHLPGLDHLVHKNRTGGEDALEVVPQLYNLPSDPGDFGGHALTDIFLDYERFLSSCGGNLIMSEFIEKSG
jgi:hypothetical protein